MTHEDNNNELVMPNEFELASQRLAHALKVSGNELFSAHMYNPEIPHHKQQLDELAVSTAVVWENAVLKNPESEYRSTIEQVMRVMYFANQIVLQSERPAMLTSAIYRSFPAVDGTSILAAIMLVRRYLQLSPENQRVLLGKSPILALGNEAAVMKAELGGSYPATSLDAAQGILQGTLRLPEVPVI